MDMRKITDLLRATIDPNQRASAEEQLKQVRDFQAFVDNQPDELVDPFDPLTLVKS